MLPYEEHHRAGGAEFKIPECPLPPKARGMRGRKPLPRGRRPGAKAKEKRIPAPPASPPASPSASPSAVSAAERTDRPNQNRVDVLLRVSVRERRDAALLSGSSFYSSCSENQEVTLRV